MKVLAINGSPKSKGNTHTALSLVARELEAEGIETEIITIGNKALHGCIACGGCFKLSNNQCAINDGANEIIHSMIEADGLLFGSPVYFSGVNGVMKSFLDRAFFVSSVNGGLFRHKVGAGVTAVRRSGGSATIDQLNKYLLFSEMIIPASNYWNIVHGTVPEDALGDEEGVQIMRTLGRNMAWLLKIIDHGRQVVTPPAPEKKIMTNFIR